MLCLGNVHVSSNCSTGLRAYTDIALKELVAGVMMKRSQQSLVSKKYGV
jgi:hypothetical protein